MVGKRQQQHQDTTDSKFYLDQPEGWVFPKISDILTINYGKGLKKASRKSGIVPVYGSNGVVGKHDSSLTEGPTIIIGRKGTVGAVNFSSVSCWPIDTTYFIDYFHGLVPRYIFYATRYLNLGSFDTSTAIPGLNRNDIYNQQIPLPPVSEQKRIVAKVEELLARVNAVRERLARVKEILKRFRQSVLSAACSGRLPEEWRQRHQDIQTAVEHIKRVQLNEKKSYLKECEDAKESGKRRPNIPPLLQLKEIKSHPEINTWAMLKMNHAFKPGNLFDGPFGSNLKTSDYTEKGVRVIRLENIYKRGEISGTQEAQR